MRAGHTNVQEMGGWVQECGGCRTPKNTVGSEVGVLSSYSYLFRQWPACVHVPNWKNNVLGVSTVCVW